VATGGWLLLSSSLRPPILLLSSSLRPPILLLSIAIGAVQLFSLLRGTARYAERLASHDLGLRVQVGLRGWLYRRLEHLVPVGLPGGDRGDLLAGLVRDTEEAQDLVVRTVVPVLAAALTWAAAVVTAATLLPAAGAVILAAGVLAAVGTAVSVLLAGRSAALPAARGRLGSWVHGAPAAREELAALGAADWALAQLAARERALGARTRAAAAAVGFGRAACALAGGAGLAGVAWAGAAAVRSGRIGPVELGVLVFLALGTAALLQGLPDAAGRLPVSRASLDRLTDIGRVPVSVTAPGPDRRPAGTGRTHRAPVVALRGAAACYPDGRGRLAFRGLDLELVPGRPVALAGPNGSGKTLAVYTLLRFADLAAGTLSIDGTDARDLPPERIRALLAWSPEQPILFPASLRANLRLGAPQATDREMTELLGRFGLAPWLDRLERGLDTVLAPWGHPVSGGELQRLSLARAVLTGRPVLVLDEPTSHLDQATAGAVLEALLEHARGRSVLWVTHRPAELALFPDVRHLRGGMT
jgi:ATP-binding cassette, subfamily C, bacterial CydCD